MENLFRTVPLEISGRGISQFPKNMKKHLSVVVKKVVDLAQGGCLWGVSIPPPSANVLLLIRTKYRFAHKEHDHSDDLKLLNQLKT